MSNWTLFLDSTRVPMYGAIACRSVAEAKAECLRRGAPEHLVLEFYMGVDMPSGLDFANWLVKLDRSMDGEFIPKHFTYYVHSQNLEGRDSIEDVLGAYMGDKRGRYVNEDGIVERRDRSTRGFYPLVNRRVNIGSSERPSMLMWGNLSGKDYAKHTRHQLVKKRND